MVHLHHHKSNSVDEEESEEHHVSIASLRNKFENLAHGHVHSAPKSAAATPSSSAASATPVPPRVSTPSSLPGSAPSGSGSLRPASGVDIPVASPPASVPASIPPSVPPKNPALSVAGGIPPRSGTPPITRPTSAAPPPPPQPQLIPASPVPLKPEAGVSTLLGDSHGSSNTGADAGESFSVKDLRERFGQRSPAPPIPSKSPNIEALRAATKSPEQLPTGLSGSPAGASNVLLKPRPVLPTSISQGASPILTKPISSSPPPLGIAAAKPPPPKPPISRSNSPNPLERVAAGMPTPSGSTPSRSDSPGVGHRPAPPPPPASRAQLVPSSPATSRSSSPAVGHRPAPPPPRAVSPSPRIEPTSAPLKPPLPVRKATLPATPSAQSSLDSTAASIASSGPPPIPGNRPKSSSNASILSSPPAPAPPPLPQTKRPVVLAAATPVDSTPLPPPLLRTSRPSDASVPAASSGAAPPPLPATKRPDAQPQQVAVPPLPTRRPTLETMSFPPPTLSSQKTPGSTVAKEKSLPLPRSTPIESVPYRPRASTVAAREPLAPVASAPPRLPTRRGSTAVGGDDGYLPPPPPLRNNNPPPSSFTAPIPAATIKRSSTTASPINSLSRSNSLGAALKRNASAARRGGVPGGDSDDEDGEGGAQPLTTMAQRLLDEHPDSTQANRRPPQFSPHVHIAPGTMITAFASYGRYACIAHHTVRVFDVLLSTDTPIFTFDQKDTGMETRSKEPRITAMGFRPSSDPDHAGRYLWCGSKDGHLWELDIHTGEVTATRPGIHGGAITHIWPHELSTITLDDVGKLHVWETPKGGTKGIFKVTSTVRISDKVTFAKIIKGRLWTAVAPAVRSATNNAASRGPTVRVYDLTTTGQVPPPLVALTTEWTGAATSATVMPLGDSNVVYIGHEGGFVSVWTTTEDQLICEQVLKVSSTDILSLEGVGERLWAGNRRGQIHVWNIFEKPWITTNVWITHDEQPIHNLSVDPYAIGLTGRFMLWSVSRDSINAWDGLLAVDWIDKQMVERQIMYCDFRDLKVLVCSWNIDSSRPTDLTGSTANVTFLDQVLNSVDAPDIVVFGFQEVVPLTDKKLTAKTLLFGHKGKDGGGATNDRVSERYRAWADKLQHAVRLAMPQETPYVKVHSEQLVGLFMCMFVKQNEREALRDVKITTVKRGIGGIYGNKGAIVARMVVDDTSMCFINVHLAAGQSHRAARTADLAAIMEDKAIFPSSTSLGYVNGGNGTGILDHEMVVLNGDLNYRIDQRREVVISSIQSGDLDFLLPHDQLHKEMRGNHAFRLRNFVEPPITFAPTYKYDPGTNNYDSSDKRRIPAWCDRVLYLKNDRIRPLNYQRYEITCSDHKPVSAGLEMKVKRVNDDRMRATHSEVLADWAAREAEMLPKIEAAYVALY